MRIIRLSALCSSLLLGSVAGAQDGPSPDRPFVFAREIWRTPESTTEVRVPPMAFFQKRPSSVDYVKSMEGASNSGEGYVQRIHGWIEAPETGSYRFFLASDDHAELWLSSDEDPAKARLIASVEGYTQPREFTRQAPRMSRAITLIKGSRHYLEARHREGSHDDHLSVGWIVPRAGLDEAYVIGTHPTPTFTCEVYRGVDGGDPAGLMVFDSDRKPDRTSKRSTMATPSDIGEKVATRLWGSIVVPKTGDYVFLLSADDAAVLYVSPSGDPKKKVRVCSLQSWVDPGNWKGQSTPIALKKGQTIYVEARHVQGAGPGHVHVGWRGPEGFQQAPIRSNPTPQGA